MSAAGNDLLQSVLAAVDARDVDRFAGFLTEDATFRFASADAVTGRDEIREAVGAFFDSVAALRHRVEESWVSGEDLICRGEVTYTRLDGSELAVPFANVLKLLDGRIAEYRIYVDASAL